VQLVFLVVVLWVIPFFVAYRIAFEKNRFGLLYGFFGWIGVVAVALLPPVYYGGSEKTCPDCAEHVLVDANVCRYCGYRFSGADADEESG
jgi:hypothetical protein